jgi:putative transposase
LKYLQRSVSRKVIGSKNRKKAVYKLAKLHELISNQRHDFQHKVSNRLISENQAIAVETLNIKGMMKNHNRAQSTGDAGWYSFVLKLQYKAQWLGKTILKIGQWEPSSKTCNVCGYKYKDLTEEIRKWQCPDCGTNHDRDINAAINIKNFSLINVGTTG